MFDPDFDYTQLLSEEEIARAKEMTVEQVLLEAFHDLILVGKLNGLDDDEIDALIHQLVDERAAIKRHGFRLHVRGKGYGTSDG